MIEESLTLAKENIIIHQVNCAGKLSQQNQSIFDTFPKAKEEYVYAFNQLSKMGVKHSELLGENQIIQVTPDKYVINMFSQTSVRKRPCDKTIYTNYEALEDCLKEINTFAQENDYAIALPYLIGVGAPNGNWQIIKEIIENAITVNYNYYTRK